MPSSVPSRADLDLIALLAQDGIAVSRGQLDRWRQRGLLPRSTVERLGARGSRAHHPPGLVGAVAVLATEARRGRPWQMLGLIMLASGAGPEPDGLRGALHWALDGIFNGPPEPGQGAPGSGAEPDGARDRAGAAWESGHRMVGDLRSRIVADLAAGLDDEDVDRYLLLTLQERYDETAEFGDEDYVVLAGYKARALGALVGGDAHLAAQLELRTWRVVDVEGWWALVDVANDDALRQAARLYGEVLESTYGHLSVEERLALPCYGELITHAVALLEVLRVHLEHPARR